MRDEMSFKLIWWNHIRKTMKASTSVRGTVGIKARASFRMTAIHGKSISMSVSTFKFLLWGPSQGMVSWWKPVDPGRGSSGKPSFVSVTNNTDGSVSVDLIQSKCWEELGILTMMKGDEAADHCTLHSKITLSVGTFKYCVVQNL